MMLGNPLFWLVVSILLVAVSLTAVLMVAIPAMQELARAARSAEKLFDTLNRELPQTMQALRSTGAELGDLTDELTTGVQRARQVVQQVDESVTALRQQAQQAQVTTRSLWAGVKAAWRTWQQTSRPTPRRAKYGPPRRLAAAARSRRSPLEDRTPPIPPQSESEIKSEQ